MTRATFLRAPAGGNALSRRASGVLLHPTSLPGPHGIGDLGDGAYRWLDFLAAGQQSLWQVLPLGPPGYGDSPYDARSAFAGNPLLISLDRLAADGLLTAEELGSEHHWPADHVDYEAVAAYKGPLLRRAYDRFHERYGPRPEPLERFCAENAAWLEDYALFGALRDAHVGADWRNWEPALVRREPLALARARTTLDSAIELAYFREYVFWEQWRALKREANQRGIQIIGDIPIFVAHDSADVWAHQELFLLDERGEPSVVAGVPPDYFSPTGQRWGNPLYRWDALAQSGYRWWIDRFRRTMQAVDVIRIDHFRGFQAFWEIPAGEETAVNGRWVPGPGEPFFRALSAAHGAMPLVVEDLGVITPDVEQLRDALGYPGMKVLQFAYGGDPENRYLPHNYERNFVVYTGTHDNDTTEGWFAALSDEERVRVIQHVGASDEPISRKLIWQAMSSVARTAIVPLQDVHALGGAARMNRPGVSAGNWTWRARPEQIAPEQAGWLSHATGLFGRAPVHGARGV